MALTAATKLAHSLKWVMAILGGFDNESLERAEKMAQENNCKIELTINPRSFSDMGDSVKVYISKGNDCYYINEECEIELTINPRSFSDMDDSVKVCIWKGSDCYYRNEEVIYVHDIKIRDENGDVISLKNADMQSGNGVSFT